MAFTACIEGSACRKKLHAIAPGAAPHAFSTRNFDANNGAPGRASGQRAVDNPPPAAYYFRLSAMIDRAS
jgi:hypothetical protein